MSYKVVGEKFGDGPWAAVSKIKQTTSAASGDILQPSSPGTPATPASAADSSRVTPSSSLSLFVDDSAEGMKF